MSTIMDELINNSFTNMVINEIEDDESENGDINIEETSIDISQNFINSNNYSIKSLYDPNSSSISSPTSSPISSPTSSPTSSPISSPTSNSESNNILNTEENIIELNTIENLVEVSTKKKHGSNLLSLVQKLKK
jgi:hypothetical protein